MDACDTDPMVWNTVRLLIAGKMQTLGWSLPALIILTWLNPFEVRSSFLKFKRKVYMTIR